ncbi:hypothetical protein [Actinokineospora globicatena]|uniref:hypothetical protein n=1 Tax=Actinokineospora globicatena TaxID=103729 RepID=UPI0020A4041E|nr:hypothetical protein [Actinokineospora globicatena]MCP2303595.1 hypothetical protein [Actinokineospora globicatena]GLW79268.1 hypothetical protein Aglo01_37500 [Actinokineospora globicatena]GLW86322.1 hypothetical protein Aglo02_39610 [Actinokineospora globicatena]
MAVGKAGGSDDAPGFQWTLTLLPAFPIVLLVLRLWQLSGQDLNTMLLLVQHVHALELASSLVISLLEVPPAILLTAHLLGLMSLVSGDRGRTSRLERAAERTPNWLVAASVLWSLLVWELRFVPTLLLLGCAIAGLTVRKRGRADLVFPVCVVLPVAVGVLEYLWFFPAILDAIGTGDVASALLLIAPPLLAPFLTGPLPERVAWAGTHGVATLGALVTPFALLAMFLNVPVLPSVALVLGDADRKPTEVALGNVVTVDDTMTTLLDSHRDVRFVPNDRLLDKVLCPGPAQIPHTLTTAHGWLLEDAALDWLLPAKSPQGTTDPRCDGRIP